MDNVLSKMTHTSPPLQFFIKMLSNLPDGTMQSHGLLMSFTDKNAETKLFNIARKYYRAIGDWLDYYYGNASLSEELTFTEKSLYKFHAERSKAWIEIVQEVFLLSSDMQQEYKNPGLFWLLLETEFFENSLKKNGLIGNASATPKSVRYSGIIKECNFLEDSNNLLKEPETTNSPTQWFCGLAMELCAVPENYLFRSKWNNFLKTIKRCERNIERSPLKVVFLKDDELKYLVSGREK